MNLQRFKQYVQGLFFIIFGFIYVYLCRRMYRDLEIGEEFLKDDLRCIGGQNIYDVREEE